MAFHSKHLQIAAPLSDLHRFTLETNIVHFRVVGKMTFLFHLFHEEAMFVSSRVPPRNWTGGSTCICEPGCSHTWTILNNLTHHKPSSWRANSSCSAWHNNATRINWLEHITCQTLRLCLMQGWKSQPRLMQYQAAGLTSWQECVACIWKLMQGPFPIIPVQQAYSDWSISWYFQYLGLCLAFWTLLAWF
jgi:hypothetical protein